jgi:hypothetical protein
MHKTLAERHSGKLPADIDDLVKLPGPFRASCHWRRAADASSLSRQREGSGTMAQFVIDTQSIRWKCIEGIDHLSLSVLDVDRRNGILHVLFKFAANRQIILHRHLTLNKTFTIRGEHRLYHADGRLKEVRQTGRFTVAPPSDDPHREGAGDQDAIVLFVIYGDGALYQALDDEANVATVLSVSDFIRLYDGEGR